MNRRAFIGGLLASAAVRTWPFRVFSFPTEIKLAGPMQGFHFDRMIYDDLFDAALVGQWHEYYTPPDTYPPMTIEVLRKMREQLTGPSVKPLYLINS